MLEKKPAVSFPYSFAVAKLVNRQQPFLWKKSKKG